MHHQLHTDADASPNVFGSPAGVPSSYESERTAGLMMSLWQWFLTVTGSNDPSGTWYGFWSGFGSDLGEFAIVGSLIGVYRTRVCHARWCWRVGRAPVEGTRWVVCRKHDPATDDDEAPTAEDIAEHHRRGHHLHLRRREPRLTPDDNQADDT